MQVYILRPHILPGQRGKLPLGAFRARPTASSRAEKMRSEAKGCLHAARGQQYLDNKIQFVHVDDMARLLAHILHRIRAAAVDDSECRRTRRAAYFARCIEMRKRNWCGFRANGRCGWCCSFCGNNRSRQFRRCAAYMTGEYIMNTDRLRTFWR